MTVAAHSFGSSPQLRSSRLISFAGTWVNGARFESTLLASGGAHEAPEGQPVVFHVSAGTRLMIDATLRLLSLANQLVACEKAVTLDFADGLTGAAGYLNRMGFFDHLDPRVHVLPARPRFSDARTYRGRNGTLVEIEPLPVLRGLGDRGLPRRLTEALLKTSGDRPDAKMLRSTTLSLLSELISNVYDHSQTQINGYAALQLYAHGNQVQVVVSDSGLGIVNTLRPALAAQAPGLMAMSDTELVVEAFRSGLSRYGLPERGTGLKSCARHAMKFNATLDVRLDEKRVTLRPIANAYEATATGFEKQARLFGTHISFSFLLT